MADNFIKYRCTTCQQNSWSCSGHCGHIELPVHIYNVTFFDQLYRLLRAQCVYCHRFRLSRNTIQAFACKLRLLRFGLVDCAAEIDEISASKGSSNSKPDEEASDAEDPDDLIKRRETFVKKSIKNALSDADTQLLLQGMKNPVAVEQRKTLIRDFFKAVVAAKKCASCSG